MTIVPAAAFCLAMPAPADGLSGVNKAAVEISRMLMTPEQWKEMVAAAVPKRCRSSPT
jgi:hypothetical protein